MLAMTIFQTVKRFCEPVLANKKWALFLFSYSILMALYTTYKVVVLEKITMGLEQLDQDKVMFRLGGMLLLVIGHYLTKIFMKPYVFHMESGCKKYMDEKILTHLLGSENTDFERIGTGRMLSLVQKWVSRWTAMIMQFLRGRTIMLFTVIFSLIIVMKKSPIIFFLTIGLVLLAYFWIKMFARKALDERRWAKDTSTTMDRMYVRWFMSKFEIQQSDGIEKEVDLRNTLYKKRTWHRVREKILQAYGYDTFMLVSSFVYMVFVTYIAAKGVLDGNMQISDFVVLTWLAMMVQSNIFALQMELRRAMDDAVEVEKLWNLLDWLKMMKNRESGKQFAYKQWNIELQKVSFSYEKNDSKQLFDGFSYAFTGGQKTALVWPSWWWKSTLIKLMSGYIKPTIGWVFVDGQELSDLALQSYYRHIGYLTQEPGVFDGTIRENLEYGLTAPSISEQKTKKAIANAQCEFVYDFPQGLDTEIGERWIRLSWGQRQRLAIAKIFMKNPEIIFLDEPTSALDSESEEAITEAMNKLFEWRTVIIIAHRLQTVKNADQIIYIENGAVVEQWNHTELMKQEWHYWKMVELQSGF